MRLPEQVPDLSQEEINHLAAWGTEEGLAVSICPGIDDAKAAYVSFCDGIARWIIHRNRKGMLRLDQCSDGRTGTVETVETATAIIDEELRRPIPQFFALHLAGGAAWPAFDGQ